MTTTVLDLAAGTATSVDLVRVFPPIIASALVRSADERVVVVVLDAAEPVTHVHASRR